jgi:hypothetical protein
LNVHEWCCETFANYTRQSEGLGAGGAALHQADDGSWNVNGCCGGGCYMVIDLRFCPWCGKEIVT